MNNIKIIGFSSSADLADKGVSCTNGFLCNHLKSRGIVSEVVKVNIPKWRKYQIFLKNVSLEKNKWFFGDRISVEKAELKSNKIHQVINDTDICSTANICLQIGSDFRIHQIEKLKHMPKFSYHDNNILAFLKTKHGLSHEAFKGPIDKIVRFEKNIYHNLDGIFTMTEYLRNSFINDFGISENKVHTIGVGCNFTNVCEFEKKITGTKILFVAKDSFKQKGGDDVLQAFQIIKSVLPDAKLVIVGQNIKTNDESVICTGYIDKSKPEGEERLKNLYKEASVFVMPSYVEATGNVFLEAMSCKLPCVGADVSAMPEIICGNDCGFVAKPGDVTDLAGKILCILENKEMQVKFGENGFKAVLQKYNWDVVCEKAIKIMESHLK